MSLETLEQSAKFASHDREPNEVEAVPPQLEMNVDSIMLDSPAQTPTPKSHHAPPASSGTVPTDIAMMIDESNSGAPAATANPTSWDTKKYREELSLARSKLQHKNFDIGRQSISFQLQKNNRC